MSCFLLSKDLTNKMNFRLRSFFWGGSISKKMIHWAKGSILIRLKCEGGLGFKYFHSFNLALLAKQGWRLIQKGNQLWAKLLKGL
ncbi:Putative ribonuclease H protein At1g65750 [Linum perenne]